MTREEFIEKIKNEFLGINLVDVEKKIIIYSQLLNEFNKNMNLTRLDNKTLIYKNYFYESVTPYRSFDFFKINSLLDIGSGSGIPGVVLKILYPHIHLTIVEANNKKCLFLNKLIKELSLDNIDIFNIRAEDYAHKNLERFDFITCRAVAQLKILLELATPMCKINGLMVFPKSKNYLHELKEAQKIIKLLKCDKYEVLSYDDFDKIIKVFVFYKDKRCDLKYPRSWQEIIK